MRVVLALPPFDRALADEVSRFPGIDVVKDSPYYSAAVLESIRSVTPPVDVVLVREDLDGDQGFSLLDFVRGLRTANIRVIFLADQARPGDVLLSELVGMGVYDIVVGGSISLEQLKNMLTTPATWGSVAHLQQPGRTAFEASPGRPAERAAPVREVVREVVKEVIVERTQTLPQKGVTVVVGLGAEGVGVTTIATSLAAVLARTEQKVALIDADPRNAAMVAHLALGEEHNGLKQLLDGIAANRAGETAEGVWVYGSRAIPHAPTASSLTEADAVSLVDRLMAAGHNRIVVDAGHQLRHPFTKAVLQLATDVIIVVDLDVYRTMVAIQYWPVLARTTGPFKCRLVVNRVSPSHRFAKAEDVATSFDQGPTLAAAIPLVPEAADAMIQGQSLYNFQPPDSPFAKAIRTLSGLAEPQKQRKGWFGL